MGKTTDTFGRLKFRLPVNLPFLAKTYGASRENNRVIDISFRLHSELYPENTQSYFCEMYGVS